MCFLWGLSVKFSKVFFYNGSLLKYFQILLKEKNFLLFNENFLKFLRSKLSKTEVALILLATIIPFYIAASLSCQRVVSRTFSSKDFLLPKKYFISKKALSGTFFILVLQNSENMRFAVGNSIIRQ